LSKHRCGNLLKQCNKISTIKGQKMMDEGKNWGYIYIVVKGEFRGLKQVVRKDSKAHSNGVR